MAWLGICYEGVDSDFLPSALRKHEAWLSGDRMPKLYGSNFVVIYDSNTARELIKKLTSELATGRIVVYTIPSVLLDVKR